MKSRVRIDITLLIAFIIISTLLYFLPVSHNRNLPLEFILELVGILTILKGTFFRMSGRGHKKTHSQEGHGLVRSGPYSIVRNPMYLGTFLTGAGFILIVWPWWMLPIFTFFFYLRFRMQIMKEEEHLNSVFGPVYREYCLNIPPFFPSVKRFWKRKFSEIFPYQELWTTQEKYGLMTWPVLVFLVEIFKETILFGKADVANFLIAMVAAAVIFVVSIVLFYRFK